MSGLSPSNDAERALMDAARKGEDEDLARFSTDGSGKALVRAEFLRDLILQKNGCGVHERGIRFRNACIRDQLDLSHCRIDFPLVMRECEFGDEEEWREFCEKHKWDDEDFGEHWEHAVPLNVERARLHFLQLDASTFHGGLMAERAHIKTGLFMDDCVFTATVWLRSALIKGSLSANRARFEAQTWHALDAQGADIASNCVLDEAKFSAIYHMPSVKIGGQLSANSAKFKAKKDHAFNVQRAEIAEDCFLRGAEFSATCHMPGAKIGGQLSANGAKFKAETGHAINAQGVEIADGCFLRGAEFSATCHLPGAKIGSQLVANDAKFKAETGDAINAQGAEIADDCFLSGAEFSATCHMPGAKIGGQLAAEGAKFMAETGNALNAQGAEIADACFLLGAEFSATCHMPGTKIGSQLVANGTKFKTKEDIALNAQGAEVKEGAYFRPDDTGEPTEFTGEVCFVSARLGGLFMEGTQLTARPGGNAMNASNCIINGDCRLRKSDSHEDLTFIAYGSVIFIRTKIKGKLSLSGARLFSQHAAWGLSLGAETRLPPPVISAQAGIHAESTLGPEGAENEKERTRGKRPFGGMLQGRMDSRLRGNDDEKQENSTITAFSFVEGRAERLIMPETEPPRGVVDLTRAHVGTLKDHKDGWPGDNGNAAEEHLVLDGFTYDHLRNPAGRSEEDGKGDAKEIANAREIWLLRQKPEHLNEQFRPQPWRQLVRALRRDGHVLAAEELSILHRQHARKVLLPKTSLRRLTDWFLDVTSGYGYRPWRTVGWSLGVIFVFFVFWSYAMLGCAQQGCRDESVFVHTKVAEYTLKPSRGGAPATYPDFNPLGFSFDVFIPLFNFGYQDTWAVNTSWHALWQRKIPHPNCMTAGGRYAHEELCASQKNSYLWNFTISVGGLLYLAYLLEIFLGAILVAIAIAGFTGLIGRRRKEE